MENHVNILGTDYEIIVLKYEEDERFKDRSIDGYCDAVLKRLVLCDMHTWPKWDKETDEFIDVCRRRTLRHEIVHAFFEESGLSDSALRFDGAWAGNEELVDWIAAQGPKIHDAWQAAGAL